jgi:hypothetical protein
MVYHTCLRFAALKAETTEVLMLKFAAARRKLDYS